MIKFGTGGFRAIIGDGFTKVNLQYLAGAMSMMMKDEKAADKGIIIGYDRRFLSKEAMQWMAEVFASYGIKAYLINKSAPTPLVMYMVSHHDFPYGMMVTASHNPALYNGVKIFMQGGRDADEIKTASIEEYFASLEEDPELFMQPLPYDTAKDAGLINEIYPLNEYLDSIIESIDMDAIKRHGLKIALDPMYGVSETSLKTILLTARCEVETIHERHDTLFGGKLPAPTADTLKPLKEYVLDGKFDLGIATDGDADRIGVIDDKGNFLHPNDILVLLYYYLHKYKGWTGPAVRNICTTHLLDRVAASFGEECFEVPVGFKHISAKMNATNALIGGESSGGMAVRGHIRGKDGIYASALLVEMIAVTGKNLSELISEIREEYGEYYFTERDYRFSAEKKAEIMKIIMVDKLLPDYTGKDDANMESAPSGIPEIERISYLDGLKIYYTCGGWISVRFSGTEPLLRIFAEMPTPEGSIRECERFEQFLDLK